jgi:hypothetical protein
MRTVVIGDENKQRKIHELHASFLAHFLSIPTHCAAYNRLSVALLQLFGYRVGMAVDNSLGRMWEEATVTNLKIPSAYLPCGTKEAT